MARSWRKLLKWMRGNALWDLCKWGWQSGLSIIMAAALTVWGYIRDLPGPILATIFLGSLAALLVSVYVVVALRRSVRWEWPWRRRKTSHQPIIEDQGIGNEVVHVIEDGMMLESYENGLNFQVDRIHNAQTAVSNTATNVTTDVEYSHPSGEVYLVKKAAWLKMTGPSTARIAHSEFIDTDGVVNLVIVVDTLQTTPTRQKTYCATFNDSGHQKALAVENWNLNITLTYDDAKRVVWHKSVRIGPTGGCYWGREQ